MNIWKIEYRAPICGGNREHIVKTPTLLNAVADFNLHKGGFDTPLRITRLAIGDYPETWTMQGRYDVPRQVNEDQSHKWGLVWKATPELQALVDE